MRLLDLFCGAGGASEGYVRAGFEVVGVDIKPQPRYPHTFIQADALTFPLDGFDAIHASPPCQRFSDLANRNKNHASWPDLISPMRDRFLPLRVPWIIENVEGSPLHQPVRLCGTMFPELRVLRHRLFESNIDLVVPAHPAHPLVFTYDKRKAHFEQLDQNTAFVQVTGGGNATLKNKRDAMGIDWMLGIELNEAIPPAYTKFLGQQIFGIEPKPRLLDLFCGAGGASEGYARAGFDVTGVDICAQPHYPFRFYQADAMTFPLAGFDFIHASPPCQAYSATRRITDGHYPDLVAATRTRLQNSGATFVIENVPGAPLLDPIELCGLMFGLRTYRHRLFESNAKLTAPAHGKHVEVAAKMGRPVRPGQFMKVVGNFSGVQQARDIMDCQWMVRNELSQAIPPAYTECLGRQLLPSSI